MAKTAGKSAVFKVAAAGGTALVDLTTYIGKITGPSPSLDEAEVSTLGSTDREFVTTLRDPGSFQIEGPYQHFMGTFLQAHGTITSGSASAFEYYPQGTVTGNSKWSGSVYLSAGPEIENGVDDATMYSAEFRITGSLALGTA